MTILIGKNSSGKSAVAKLPTLIEGSFKMEAHEPFQLENDGVELGGELKDLVYGRKYGNLEFEFEEKELDDNGKHNTLKIQVNIDGSEGIEKARIMEWQFYKDHYSFDDTINNYVDENNEKKLAHISFGGFNPYNTDPKRRRYVSPPPASDLRTDYLGPFRIEPERILQLKKQNTHKIGKAGENAYQLLCQDAVTTSKILLTKVNEWYKQNFEGWGVHVNQDKQPYYQIELVQEDKGIFINLRDVGQGMSQALPLVVRAFVPDEQDTLIIMEQPELHLHPAAHGNLAELFAQSTIDKPHKHYLIETHSENFVLRLRALVAEGRLKPENLAIYYVNFDTEKVESNLELIPVDAEGEVENWPEGIFNEGLGEVMRIRQAQQ